MTKNKRFTIDNEENGLCKCILIDGEEIPTCEVVKLLNSLTDENEQLKKENEESKQEYLKLKHRHSLLHDECLDAECERDSLKKDVNSLEKENERLKKENTKWIVDYNGLNTEYQWLKEENEQLKELLELISRAHSFTKEESVKEILRHEIKAIDTVTGDSAMAWNDYCALSKFFKKQYGEHWDNE